MEDDLKRTLITEYKAVIATISDCHETLRELNPRSEALAKLIQTYGWGSEIEKPEPDDDIAANPDAATSKGQKIAHLVSAFFDSNNNQWTRLSDLYVYLTGNDIQIGGKNPNSNLSAHLFNSGLFEGDRAKGWRLKAEAWKVIRDPKSQITNALMKGARS